MRVKLDDIYGLLHITEGTVVEFKTARGGWSGADVIVKGWEDQKWTKPVLSEHIEPERVEMVMKMVKGKGVVSVPVGKELARGWQGAWRGFPYIGAHRRILQGAKVAGGDCQAFGTL